MRTTAAFLACMAFSLVSADEKSNVLIDGSGPGWVPLTADDFAPVNSADDTWSFEDNLIKCTGKPISVLRTKKSLKNFELVSEWRHLKPAGNSGFFVWCPLHALEKLDQPGLPGYGIEVQVLDLGYKTNYEKNGRKADWFTCHGDVFAVGSSKMKPFAPISPNGRRSFPTEDRSKGVGEWNHYYVRAINGEVRLWVNGKEVSGGNACDPAEGHLCLESEGSPLEFRGLKIRELP